MAVDAVKLGLNIVSLSRSLEPLLRQDLRVLLTKY